MRRSYSLGKECLSSLVTTTRRKGGRGRYVGVDRYDTINLPPPTPHPPLIIIRCFRLIEQLLDELRRKQHEIKHHVIHIQDGPNMELDDDESHMDEDLQEDALLGDVKSNAQISRDMLGRVRILSHRSPRQK